MQFWNDLSIIHYDVKEIPCIVDKGAPTNHTAGAIGVLYMDSGSGSLYKCVAADSLTKTYNWVIVGAGDPEEIRLAVEAYFKQNPISTAGLTATEKNLMLALFKAVPYQSDVSATMKSLKAIWNSSSGGDSGGEDSGGGDSGVTYHSVTYNLTRVTADSTPASVIEGGSLTVNLTPDTNAVLGEVVVTMGGVDVTATAYSNSKISISSVTGDVVITATATVANYTQVEYLEATETGGVGFLTNYTPAKTDLVELEFTPMLTSWWLFPFCWSTNNATCAFCTRLDDVAGRTSYTRRPNSSYNARNETDPTFAMPSTTGIRYRFAESAPGTATLYKDDGTEMVTLVDANAGNCVEPSSPVGLFSWFDGTTIRANSSAKGVRMHSFKITDVYGATKLDVIPVLDADGIACMYDKISGEYFYDVSGNNTFTAGGAV